MAYEVATFRELRERLRCKEIWVVGADRWRNPDEDLPADFEARRAEHYRELRKPLDAEAFTGPLREEMRAELATLEAALPWPGGCRSPPARPARSSSRRWRQRPSRGTCAALRARCCVAGVPCR
jgi:hypothetical protein